MAGYAGRPKWATRVVVHLVETLDPDPRAAAEERLGKLSAWESRFD